LFVIFLFFASELFLILCANLVRLRSSHPSHSLIATPCPYESDAEIESYRKGLQRAMSRHFLQNNSVKRIKTVKKSQ